MSEKEGEGGGRVEEEGGGRERERERGRFVYRCGYKKVYILARLFAASHH